MLDLSVWAVVHVLHSRHFLSWDMGTPHDAIWIQPYISVPALELLSRAVPSVGGYHHHSVGPTTGRNPIGRQKKSLV